MYRTVSLTNEQFQLLDSLSKKFQLPKGQLIKKALTEMLGKDNSGSTLEQFYRERKKRADEFFKTHKQPKVKIDLENIHCCPLKVL